jgi:ribosomal-protein-alanine N-acetyltransferase
MAVNRDLARTIRPMMADDLDRVTSIEAATFPNPWPREALAYELEKNPFCAAFVAERGGAVAAYAYIWVIYEEAHLINIAVDAAHRGRGVGEALMVHALRHAAAEGAERVHLEVRETNAAAIALYRRYGFQVIGRAESYYSDGTPALFMETSLEAFRPPFRPGLPASR